MTTLVTADLHLSDNPRDDYRHRGMATIAGIVEKHKVDRVLILGDLCDEKDRHGAWLVNRVAGHVDHLTRLAEVLILRGNHDYIVQSTPFFRFLHLLCGRVTWINHPQEIVFRDIGRCLFLPHTSNWKEEWAGWNFKAPNWIFAHNTFEGAQVGDRRSLSGIPTEIFPDIRHKVIAGDIHVPQRVGPVTYVGAPYLVDFGDSFEPRVLLLTADDEGPPKSIFVPGPQKRLIEVAGDDLGAIDDQGMEGDIVKIRVQLEPGEYARWADIRSAAKAAAEGAGFIVHSVIPVVDKPASGPARRVPRARRSDEQVLAAYAKRQGLDRDTTDAGLKLLQES